MDIRKVKAIEKANKQRWVKHFGEIPDESGIYVLTREENGFKYAYIGQAKHILTRLAQHLSGYQHIDLSLKKHGFYGFQNYTGWGLSYFTYPVNELDEAEQHFIRTYANAGYQLRNKTAGGQGEGKFEIAETRAKKGYREGLQKGYENARRDVAKLFDKNLSYGINGKPNKNKEKALKKFQEFLSNGQI